MRVDAVDYSVDPRVIGRFVDRQRFVGGGTVRCDGQVVARHARCWAACATITGEAHVGIAAGMRHALADQRSRRAAATRRRHDGHRVALRALPDYDALFGVDFDSAPTTVRNSS